VLGGIACCGQSKWRLGGSVSARSDRTLSLVFESDEPYRPIGNVRAGTHPAAYGSLLGFGFLIDLFKFKFE
jgi:hypothetical protein